MQKTMYPAQVNSPGTEIASTISAVQDTILLVDALLVPAAPNLLTIGTDDSAETILYTGKSGNNLTGVTRGFQGTSKEWPAGSKVSRFQTAYDHDTFKENIEEIYDRLDTPNSSPVTLQPIIQVINAKRDALFKLGDMKGRTLVNLVGNKGSCEAVGNKTLNYVTESLDTTNKVEGASSLKYVSTTGNGEHFVDLIWGIPVVAGEHYILTSQIKRLANCGVAASLVYFNSSGVPLIQHVKESLISGSTADSGFSLLDLTSKVPATAAFVMVRFAMRNSANAGIFAGTGNEGFNLDSVSLTKVSGSEFTQYASLSDTEKQRKYPFTTGIVGVENPYVINTSDNLLPPIYEWNTTVVGTGAYSIASPYSIWTYGKDMSNYVTTVTHVPIIPNQTYTLSGEISKEPSNTNDCLFFYWLDSKEERLPGEGTATRKYKGTYVAPPDARFMQIYIHNDVNSDQTVNKSQALYNPALVPGAVAKPFQPQSKSMLAFQTELHSNPGDGSDSDMLFLQNEQYFKFAKWKKVVLDGSIEIVPFTKRTGFRWFRFSFPNIAWISSASYISTVKFDGTSIPYLGGSLGNSTVLGDYVDVDNTNKHLYLSVLNSDSGWGPDYNPTLDEVKACFNGWRMFDGSVGLYLGTGQKYWVSIKEWGNGGSTVTATLPTTKIPDNVGTNHWSPYSLLYRLSTDVVEPVIAEGSLILQEGPNIVNVGTGIVLRERVNPSYIDAGGLGYFLINHNSHGGNDARFKNRVEKILSIYRNSITDKRWRIFAPIDGYGKERADIRTFDFDQSDSYSGTYIKLNKSPVSPISGFVATSEKAELSDLTKGVAEVLTRVSVMEQKKAEKDAPGWIIPTLLNSWTQVGGSGYKRVGNFETFELFLTGGVLAQDTVILKLMDGYKPIGSRYKTIWARNSDSTVISNGLVHITPSGEMKVSIGFNHNALVILSFTFEVTQ